MERREAKLSPETWGVRWQGRLAAGRKQLERRLRYVVATRSDWLRHKLGSGFDPPLIIAGTRRQPRFFFSAREVPGICAIWRQRLADDAAITAGQAERICQHRFDLLGYENIACGVEIDWHTDHVNGSQAPLRPWYKLRRLLHPAGFPHAGDCRIVWELNRHQHLVTLAKAYRLTGNRKFAAEVLAQWEHWHLHNPYPLGLNWMSAREIARRSLSWLWVYFLLVNTPELPRGFRAQWLRALYLSGRHIERYALLHGAPEERLLAEGVALFAIGVLCPELQPAEEWKRRGWQIVLGEAARLARPAGGGFELSTSGQVQTVDFLLHASILAAANEVPVPPEFEATLEKMLEILGLLGRAGAPPSLGADDGGRLFDAKRNRAEHLLDPLAAGAVLFGRADFKGLVGELCEETLWLLGQPGVEEFDQLEKRAPAAESVALPEAGLYLTANSERTQQAVIDARPILAVAEGQGVAGTLSVSINCGGRALIVDPGARVQVPDSDAEQITAVPSLNNTLLLDWATPREAKKGALGGARSAVKVDAWVSGKTFDLFAGSHYGCGQADNYLLHRRWVFSLHSGFWLVRDLALGEGVHQVGVFWHLNPEILRHGGGAAMFVEAGGTAGLRVLAAEGHGWSQDIHQAFWSPVFGRTEPLNILQFSTTGTLPAEFVTLLAPVADAPRSEARLTAIPGTPSGDLVRGYRYQLDGNEHGMFFGCGPEWSLGRWKSDAEFLYWSESHDGANRTLICCNASYVESDGRRVVSCAQRLERCELVILGEQMDVYSSDLDAKVSKRALEAQATEIGGEIVPEIPARRKLKKAAGQ